MKKIAFPIALFALPILFLVFAIVPDPSAENSSETIGVVTDIFEGGVKDIVIRLAGEEDSFYINRGLEQDLSIVEMSAQLVGQEVLLVHPKRSFGGGHIYHVQLGEETVYSEHSTFTPVSLRN